MHLKKTLLVLATLAAPAWGQSAEQMARLEVATVHLLNVSVDLIIEEFPALAPQRPVVRMTGEAREALSCFLGRLEQEVGPAFVSEYLDEISAWAATDHASSQAAASAEPAITRQPIVQEIGEVCQIYPALDEAMNRNGFVDAWRQLRG